MTTHKDWCPSGRQEQLTMARTWISVFAEDTTDSKGETARKYLAWGIPAETFADFGACYATAEEALTRAQEKETRTEVVNTACRAACTALVEAMRNVKRRWLLSPPLGAEDLVSLGLKPPDRKPSLSGPPTARQVPTIINRGQASLTLRFDYVEGNPSDSANKSRRLYYKVVAPGEPLPATPDELTKSVPMNRKIETLRFEYGDSGKTVCMAVQLENGDLKGPWGPMVSSVIP